MIVMIMMIIIMIIMIITLIIVIRVIMIMIIILETISKIRFENNIETKKTYSEEDQFSNLVCPLMCDLETIKKQTNTIARIAPLGF